MSVRNYKAIKSTVKIFVTTSLIPEDSRLKTIEYKNAMGLARNAERFFREILKIGNIEILRNLNRDEVIKALENIEERAKQFE